MPAAYAQNTAQAQPSRPTFDVASIRPAGPGPREATNLDLDPSDYFRYTGGTIIASASLIGYILFAYKISDRTQADLIYARLPAWAKERYTLRATSAGPKPTKDQIRLMVQSLLADRFQLKLHTENRELPVYALVLDHAPAPGLIPQPGDTLCTKPMDQPKYDPASKIPYRSCQLILFPKGDLVEPRIGGNTLTQIAGNLVISSKGALDPRPVLDQTGLQGPYDFDITFLPPKKQTDTTTDSPEEPGATFEQALKQQAGLKLIRQTAAVPVYVIDRIDLPTEN